MSLNFQALLSLTNWVLMILAMIFSVETGFVLNALILISIPKKPGFLIMPTPDFIARFTNATNWY